MRSDAGEDLAESGRLRGEVGERTAAHDAVRMVAEDIVPVGVEIGRLLEPDGEVVAEVAPEASASDPIDASSAAAGRLLDGDVVVDPGEIADGDKEERRSQEDDEEDGEGDRSDGEEHRVEENGRRLKSTLEWHV